MLLNYRDITVKYDDDILVISNSKVSRTFDLSAGTLRTQSLKCVSIGELAFPRDKGSDFSFIGLNVPDHQEHPCRVTDVSADKVTGGLFDSEHVKVTVQLEDDFQKVKYIVEYTVYPDTPVLSSRCKITSAVRPAIYWSHRRRLANNLTQNAYSVGDSFVCTDAVKARYTVEFTGRTDYTDNVVIHHETSGSGTYCGNIIVVSDGDHRGVAILQEAPPSAERRDFEDFDFKVDGNTISSCGWGIAPEELISGVEFTGYRNTLIFFESKTDFEYQLKNYLKLRFPAIPGEASTVTVNPWGCGRFFTTVSREFLLDEVRCAAETGASTYQIDDGWQGGGGLAELIVKNRKMDLDFWRVSDMLGGSLDELIACFRKNDVEPGLWVAPSCNDEFSDWQEFAELLLDFHRRYGICIFKIDGVKVRTWQSESNLRSMLEWLRKESDGKIRFNLDTTNGQRPGYFMFLEYGNIFLENRYVCHKWGVGYHPERTLRNLWKLARYMRSEKLQIEVANPDDINPEFYAAKGEVLPSVYDFEYWVAVTMFANPLIWMAPSMVSPENRAVLKKMMTLHRAEAENIFAGTVYPAGNMPDGASMTGFAAVSEKEVQLIIYREKDEQSGRISINIPDFEESADNIITLSGNGVCRVESGVAHIEIPSVSGYLWVKFSK